jgi:anti-sigma B factor antagonist
VGTVNGGEHLASVRVGSWAMVVLPVEIDAVCARRVGDELAHALGEGVTVLIADLSGTAFCDSSGVRMLVEINRAAMDNGTGLRLVVPSASVRRVLELMGVDELLAVYPTLGEAMADAPGGSAAAPGGAAAAPGGSAAAPGGAAAAPGVSSA